jgi:outer membrane protein assembly factor BamB
VYWRGGRGPWFPAWRCCGSVGGDGGTVSALNAATGAKLWSYATSGAATSPAVVNGRVYAGSADGKIYAFGLHAAGSG